MRLAPLGDAAVYAGFAESLDLEVNRSLQALAAAVRARELPWVRDVVPALCGLALHVDPDHPQAPEPLLEGCEALLAECFASAGDFEDTGRIVEVPVCYDPEFGLDLAELAARLELPPAEIARRHASGRHHVLMVGFSPGQPYIGGLDPRLTVPRRATPRTRTPAGSIAIAIGQTAVYPYDMPGGWHVIGRTPLTVFDPARAGSPSLFQPGDRVRFTPIPMSEYRRLAPAGR